MLLAYMLQTQVALPGWVATVVVITQVVIALSFAGIAIGILIAIRKASEQLKSVGRVLQSFEKIADDGKEVVTKFKGEADAIVRTSRRLRRRARYGADRVAERLQDLDALYEVVHEELEEAALDLASLVHTVRTGGGWLGKIRRFLPGRRRRRR